MNGISLDYFSIWYKLGTKYFKSTDKSINHKSEIIEWE